MNVIYTKKLTQCRLFLTAIVLFLMCLLTVPSYAGNVSFNFTLASSCTTSAGAYKSDGTLLRTLWSKVPYSAGTHSYSWDGLDEQGLPLAAGSYQVKLISHNVNYQWEGVVGNTSTNMTGHNMYAGIDHIRGMAFSNNKGFVANGYNERSTGMRWFNVSSPQLPTPYNHYVDSANYDFVATDGTYVYYTITNSWDANKGSFVVAYDIASGNEVTFPNGTSLSPSSEFIFSSVINFTPGGSNPSSGLAVQKNGSYLFVAHGTANEIRVLDKLSGALISTISVTNPGQLATTTDDNLFAICTVGGNRVIQKYSVDSGGALTTAGTITSCQNPLSIATSPDNSTIIAADGGTSQQVKAFSTTSPFAAQWTHGQTGGFITNGPNVTNDKFWFQNDSTFIAYQAEGSFWVGDSSCFRALHFSAARAYIDKIMYLPHNYVTTADQQNASRIFTNGWLEFSVDYSQPLQQSWQLTKNWAAGIANIGGSFQGINSVVTLSNGRTYALVAMPGTAGNQAMELTSSGLRSTGITLSNGNPSITLNSDGTLRWEEASGGIATFKKRTLTGFDGSNNPIWAAATNISSLAYVHGSDPVSAYPYSMAGVRVPITSSNVLVSFDNERTHSGWHLGGINPTTNKWLWKTSPTGILDGYGTFDPNANYTGNTHWTADRNIIYGYHGEGWNGGQAGQWMHYFDNGLFVGQFGVPNFPYDTPVAGQTGNASNWILVQQGGNLYMYSGCEAVGAGAHRWKINGWNSIQEQTINVSLTANGNGSGLTGMYFGDQNLNNLIFTRNDSVVDYNWAGGSPDSALAADNFSVRWMGSVEPRYSQAYTFYTQSDDGVRLWVNGQKIIDNWTAHASMENTSTPVTLQAGKKYRIVMEYQDITYSSVAKLSWSSPSETKQVIPVAQLYLLQPIAINQGAANQTFKGFVTDRYFVGGHEHSQGRSFGSHNIAGIRNAAPEFIYWSTREAEATPVTYTIPNLAPNSPCVVRMHFSEDYWQDGTHRLGNISINGTQVLTNFSVYAAAGNARFKAVVKQFPVLADSTGKVTVTYSGQTFRICGLEVFGHGQYQFENGTLAGGATVSTASSGATHVGSMQLTGASVALANVFCSERRQATLAIRYAADTGANMSVWVNGVNVGQCAFADTNGWGNLTTDYATAFFNVTLNASSNNTIMIKHDAADSGAVNLDLMTIQ